MSSSPVQFKVRAAVIGVSRSAAVGSSASLRLPRIFETTQRSANVVDEDPFLPAGLLRVDTALDLGPTARSGPGGQGEQTLRPVQGQVMVLELPEGVTLISHPANLRDVLQRINPAAVDADGALKLDEALRERGASAGATNRGGVSDWISGIFQMSVGTDNDPLIEAAKRKACELIGVDLATEAEEKIAQYADLGVSWAGTKALMWAIETRLKRDPGLYRWSGGELTERLESGHPQLQADAKAGPLLVLIHGTGSSTQGSFDDLQSVSATYWRGFEQRYGNRVLALEHRSLSESPIDNALQLARALPEGAVVHLVTHSRGGLVGDLMCLEKFDGLIDGYALDAATLGEADPDERARITAELLKAHAEQRAALRDLAAELSRKKLRIERYVRVASPARGTRLASGNFDVFLSGLLSLMGWVPALKANLIYSAFKRVVLEVARNRTKPNLVPGIEAMLPGSPMAKFLARATPQSGIELAVISGDIEGGGWLKKLAVLFTDFTFFDNCDNDLVVDTDAMSAGIARPDNARVLFDQGPAVSHFHYFSNDITRTALQRWLLDAAVDQIDNFKPLPALDDKGLTVSSKSRSAGASAAAQPVTILLPGVMGSHLWLKQRDRVWFSVPSLLVGGLSKIERKPGAAKDDVSAEALFAQFYGDLHEHLQSSHRTVAHAYDWRLPMDVLADQLANVLREQLDATAAVSSASGTTPAQPVRVLAHSMGGLVVRALVHKHPKLWDELMQRDGARFVMLGTPNQGSHLMVETLIGKSDTVRKLGVLDQAHDLQEVIDIIAGFPGALQLLPKQGFKDTGELQGNPAAITDFFAPKIWAEFKADMRDFWFGNNVGGLPSADVLQQAQWLWLQDTLKTPSLPTKHANKVAYVFGCASKTPCGIVKEGGAWKMLGTPNGDGSVTWDSGRIGGIGQFFYMPAEHGDLPATHDYFPAITELLQAGTGGNLMTAPPAVRGMEQDQKKAVVASYDAGPVPYPSDMELAAGLFGSGGKTRNRSARAASQTREALRLCVHAMDLRQVTQPILVGHYEQDAISGAEALIDQELVNGELTIRNHLGLYAGAVGTASAVLLNGTDVERQRGSYRGAVVAGLGPYDGSLTVGKLTDAVRTASLRYLITVLDSSAMARGVETMQGITLASLLLGYNSSANLTIGDSVQALVRGVMDANRQFAQITRSQLRITTLDLVEIYIDTAITATYATQAIAKAMNDDPRVSCRVNADATMHQGEGMRHRLLDGRGGGYWPRLMISDADRPTELGLAQAAQSGPQKPAENLRYLYLGQRARAESVVQQRQPGLVEQLVESQVGLGHYEADFSRTLFQLLIPHDFKDAARQMQQMVFVLDNSTANLPWELMLADDQPLATRTAMIRQLASNQYRVRVNQTLEARAYVVGNPSTAGFGKAFPAPKGSDRPSPNALDDLSAAEQEAGLVGHVLVRQGFEVERAIGQSQRAIDIINRLYKHPYRIVHIAGHGLFDARAADGRMRSGVVLSDGLLITAAEIDAMEVVPDLVFMNCCHLGQVQREPVAFNKLAYSVARQLIEMGVRAVVVAGWAVEDAPAALFAQSFYEALMQANQTFGEAVFTARKTTWMRYPESITWGAYQAYGDPGWKIDPKTASTNEANTTKAQAERSAWRGVAPEELIEKIVSLRQDLQRRGERLSPTQASSCVAQVERWFKGTPPEWLARADLYAALGDFYNDLGPGYAYWAKTCFERAVLAADPTGRAPLKAIEELAQSESRLAEVSGDVAMATRAIDRLQQLVALSGAALLRSADQADALELNHRRAGRLGSAYKRKAALHARAYLGGDASAFTEMVNTLAQSASAYQSHAGTLSQPSVLAYPTLNFLFLWSLTASAVEAQAQAALALQCASSANDAFRKDTEVWNVTMVADAHLLAAVLDQSLKQSGVQGDMVLDAVAQRYEDCFSSTLTTPRVRDAVVRQIDLMRLFYEAHEHQTARLAGAGGGAPAGLISKRLRALVLRLAPAHVEPPATTKGSTQPAGTSRKQSPKRPPKRPPKRTRNLTKK
jgi:CHAT domain-containing protein/pimeloyl-ACP methyl ester carboxylesterase